MSEEPSSSNNGCDNNDFKSTDKWNVIISPDGKIYKTTKRNTGNNDEMINEIGKSIFDTDPLNISELQKANALFGNDNIISKILVDLRGYVIYEYTDRLKISFPRETINGKKITGEQIETLVGLIYSYGDNYNDFCECFSKSNDTIDNVIVKKCSA